ncbi:MarR family winged helix-turn-helix transcriptional regulator [Promicromonospora soli]
MSSQSDPVDAWLDAWRGELSGVVLPSSELTKRIMFVFGALEATVRRELAGLELTAAEFDIIVALRRGGAPYRMKPNQLTRSLMLSSGGTTNVTHRLVSRGLIVREDDPADARSTWLRLTPEGVELAERAVRANAAAHDALFRDTPPAVVEAATDALRKLFATTAGLGTNQAR